MLIEYYFDRLILNYKIKNYSWKKEKIRGKGSANKFLHKINIFSNKK